MGIFGAMTTAVAGLQAQSFALENISGNIANSQTTGYKRVDTSFSDIVISVGQSADRQLSGSVLAMSRPTNTLQGPISASAIDTHMAVSGDGYFQVQKKIGDSDGEAQFSGANVYTRRGDFVMDREGYLVNGAGNYLMAIPVDPATGNPVGDVPQLLQLSTGLLEARASTRVEYHANLPKTPRVGNLDATDYTNNPGMNAATPPTAPILTGLAYNTIDLSADPDNLFTFDVNGTPITLTNGDGSGGVIDIDQAVGVISGQLPSNITVEAGTGADAGKLIFTSSDTGSTSSIVIDNISASGTGVIALGTDLGFGTTASATGVDAIPAGTGLVTANDFATFRTQSLEGGSTTMYDPSGTPADVQFRWAKMSDTPDTWNLFYQSNPDATGSQTMWTNAGTNFIFNSVGKLTSPASGEITIPNLTVKGNNLGAITMDLGSSGLTQFAAKQGDVDVTLMEQDGYAAGSLISVGVSGNGRITANYTNGQQVDVAEVPLFSFNGDQSLKREAGGTYTPTRESGPAVKMNQTNIIGQALEGSNTDIAEEFSKMIITQQAYSANSRIISTANDMMQDVLNIVR